VLKIDRCPTEQNILMSLIKTLKREMKMLRDNRISEMRQTLTLVKKIS